MEKKQIEITLEGQTLQRYEHEKRIWESIRGREIKDDQFVVELLREYFYLRDKMTEKTL